MPIRAAEPSALQSWFAVGQLDGPAARPGARGVDHAVDGVEPDAPRAQIVAGPATPRARPRRAGRPSPAPLEPALDLRLGQARVERDRDRSELHQRVQEHDVAGAGLHHEADAPAPAGSQPGQPCGRVDGAPPPARRTSIRSPPATSASRSGVVAAVRESQSTVLIAAIVLRVSRCSPTGGRWRSAGPRAAATGHTVRDRHRRRRRDREDHDQPPGGAQRLPAADGDRAVGRVRAGARRRRRRRRHPDRRGTGGVLLRRRPARARRRRLRRRRRSRRHRPPQRARPAAPDPHACPSR